jgi:hypothetical protein
MTSTLRTILAAAVLLAGCGGDDEMPPKPCAMWPVTITAGVNDKIDVEIGGGAYAASIAAATYYSPAGFAEAVRAALAGIEVFNVVDSYGIAFTYDGSPYLFLLTPGLYSRAGLLAMIVERFESVLPGATWEATLSGAHVLTIDSNAAAWGPSGTSPGWTLLGFTAGSFPRAPGVTQAGDAPLDLAAVSNGWTVTVSEQGKATIANAVSFSLLFATGANAATSARNVLGFGAVDTASATSATAQHQMENCWFAAYPAADDTGDLDDYHRAQTVSEAGVVRSIQYGSQRLVRTVVLDFIPAHKMFIAAEGANANEAIQRLFRSGWSRFRWFPDATDLATGADYVLTPETAKALPRNRLAPGTALYSVTLKMRRFVT